MFAGVEHAAKERGVPVETFVVSLLEPFAANESAESERSAAIDAGFGMFVGRKRNVEDFLAERHAEGEADHLDFSSARLLVIVLVDDGKSRKKNHYDESIVVFKAKDYDHAFERALELGRQQETTYKNSMGKNEQLVRWALVEVTEINCLGEKINGVEIASEMHYTISNPPIPFDTDFKPEEQKAHEA